MVRADDGNGDKIKPKKSSSKISKKLNPVADLKSGDSSDQRSKKRQKPTASERKRRAREKKKSTEAEPRNFSIDLSNYLRCWEMGVGWKFNKVLQSWAIDSCLREEKIDSELFNLLIPYVESVQGSQRERLFEKCQSTVAAFNNMGEDEQRMGGENLLTCIARANVLIKTLS